MVRSLRLVVFNALMMRALAIRNEELNRDELAAFRVAFQGRRFRLLITEAIIAEYQADLGESFAVQLQPSLDNHLRQGRAVFVEEHRLSRVPVLPGGVPSEHLAFIRDAIAAGAQYLVTCRRRWLVLSGQTESRYGLQIVTPAGFVELES